MSFPTESLPFLSGDGEMAALIRAHDWAATPLGAPAQWHAPLKAMVRMALTTRHPIFIFWGPEHRGLYNDAYRASLGPEQHPHILGRPGRDAWPPAVWDIVGPQVERVMRGEGATWHENQHVPIARDGALADAWWTYSFGPIDDPDAAGGIGGVLCICSETTQQVALERRLQAESDRFAQLFEQAPTFMAVLRGPEHRFELANPGYRRLVGHREVVGRTVADALPDAIAQGYGALLDTVWRTGEAYSATGAKFAVRARPDGPVDERWLDFVYQPIKDAEGTVTGIFVEGVDVTDRHAAGQRLQQVLEQLQVADQRKDEFLATLAHELRNPLAPIRTAAHMLTMPRLPAERIAWCADMIRRQSSIMATLLDDLLEVSRISSGRLELRPADVEVATLVQSAVETAQPAIDARRHALAVRLPQQLPALHVDPLRIAQVLTNLLTNAAKYTDPEGHLAVEVRAARDRVEFDVIDDGIGLAPESIESIFGMFHQAREARDRAQGGLGIGLALSQGLAGLHGGTVEAFSDGPGRGSTFRLTLPLAHA